MSKLVAKDATERVNQANAKYPPNACGSGYANQDFLAITSSPSRPTARCDALVTAEAAVAASEAMLRALQVITAKLHSER